MTTAAAKNIENPLLSRYPSQPAPSREPLETATHHNVLPTSTSFSSSLPPRKSYDDGVFFASADSKAANTAHAVAAAAAAAAAAAPKPVYDTSNCWVRVLGIATSDQLEDAMKHLSKYGTIKQRRGSISATSNIIVVQYASPFEAMAASASTFIQLTSYFFLAVQRVQDSDRVLQKLLAGNPSDSIFGASRKTTEEKKDLVMDDTDIFLSPPPKQEKPERGFYESLACWLLSITD